MKKNIIDDIKLEISRLKEASPVGEPFRMKLARLWSLICRIQSNDDLYIVYWSESGKVKQFEQFYYHCDALSFFLKSANSKSMSYVEMVTKKKNNSVYSNLRIVKSIT